MRRSLRQVKTFENIHPSNSDTSRNQPKVSIKQNRTRRKTAADDDIEQPPAKRVKIEHNTQSVQADSLLSIKSDENILPRSPPTTDCVMIKTGKKSEKGVSTERSMSVHTSKNMLSQSVDLTLDMYTVEKHDDDSKENVYNPETSDSDHDEELNYLKMRELNIKANNDFFNSIGLNQTKEALQLSTGKKKAQPSKRGLQMNKEPQEPASRRYSLRIRRIDPVGNPLPEPDPVEQQMEESRLRSGPIPMKECVYSKNGDTSHEYVQSVSSLICSQTPEVSHASTNQKVFRSALEKITITERRVAKVVPGRAFSISWHPSSCSLICVAGDKYGHIGLWDVTASENSGQDIVRAFRPHIKPVSDLFIPPSDSHKLYSCSYDSSLRCADFESEVFDEVFSVPEENDDLFRNFSFIDSAHTMLVSQFSGNISLVDTRTPKKSAEQVYPVSKKSLRTVSVHPTQPNYFITAGIDAKIGLWDLRSISSKSPKPVLKLEHHTKAISSAYFSPTGHKILSSSSDDTILIYSVNSGMKLDLSKQIRHNNYTGRWLTKFQPNWHPTVEDVFVSGSMHRPRQIEVFNTNGDLLKALTDDDYLASVCSLNVFHPNKTCTLVGANSSGRLHVFM